MDEGKVHTKAKILFVSVTMTNEKSGHELVPFKICSILTEGVGPEMV